MFALSQNMLYRKLLNGSNSLSVQLFVFMLNCISFFVYKQAQADVPKKGAECMKI